MFRIAILKTCCSTRPDRVSDQTQSNVSSSPVCVNIKAASQAADDPNHDEDQQLFRSIRELHAVASAEHRHNSLLIFKDNGEKAEGDGSDDCRKEAAPVVPDGKVDAGDLDAEEDATNGRCEAAGNTDSTGGF